MEENQIFLYSSCCAATLLLCKKKLFWSFDTVLLFIQIAFMIFLMFYGYVVLVAFLPLNIYGEERGSTKFLKLTRTEIVLHVWMWHYALEELLDVGNLESAHNLIRSNIILFSLSNVTDVEMFFCIFKIHGIFCTCRPWYFTGLSSSFVSSHMRLLLFYRSKFNIDISFLYTIIDIWKNSAVD